MLEKLLNLMRLEDDEDDEGEMDGVLFEYEDGNYRGIFSEIISLFKKPRGIDNSRHDYWKYFG